jgi:hypothetical protein
MGTTPGFIAELGRRFGLSSLEIACLERAGVRTIDAAHSLLTASAELDAAVSARLQGVRRSDIVQALEPHLSNRYREAIRRWHQSGGCRTRGAAPPSPAVVAARVDEALLDEDQVCRDELRLHRQKVIDLVGASGRDWLVRNQEERPTCIAFAAVACVELARARQGKAFEELSTQFVYWNMRQNPPPGDLPPDWAEGATKLGQAKDVLATLGVCSAVKCAYVAPLPAGTPVEGAAPDGDAVKDAATRRVPDIFYRDFPRDAARLVYDQLSRGQPVAIALPQFAATPTASRTNWDDPWVVSSGEVFDPLPGMVQASGHAVCITGFQPDPAEAKGGWFIFKNSMGTRWAQDAPDPSGPLPHVPQRGYGALSATYVDKYCWEIFSPRL